MPRVKLSPDYWLVIARDQIRRSARQVDIARVLNLDQSSVCRKIKTMSFSLPEVVALIKAGLLDKEIVQNWIDLV